ncbi:MAG: methionyl-tRNA formyltransferase [Clostridia bacterium]
MKILFMGTPEFSVASLDTMIKNNYDVVGVFTQPDKPKGRGHKLLSSAVKIYALEHNIKVYQPTTLKDNAVLDLLKELSPELIVVTAYGKLLPKYVLDFPKYGCINIHASLLPKLRGAAPIQWSIINGDTKTGITSMYMAQKLDAGDILIAKECDISPDETASSLHDKLMELSTSVLKETLLKVENNTLEPKVQNESLVSYASLLTNENTVIDFNKSNEEVYNFIRGLSLFPAAKTCLNDVNFKILSSLISDEIIDKPAGSITITKKKVLVSCKNKSCIEILELVPKGSKKMRATDYFNGHKINEMDRFNEC